MNISDYRSSIKGKTIIPITLLLFFAMTGLAFYNYFSQVSLLNHQAEDSMRTAANTAQNIIDSRLKQYQQMAAFVAALPTPTAAFAQGDRTKLFNEVGAAFGTLKTSYGFAQFQYHLPPAISFLRLHQTDKYGDDLSQIRQTVVYTNTNRKGSRGIEVGRGGLGLRGVMPVTYQGKHIGSVEFGGELSAAIDEAKEVSGLEYGVILTPTAESQAWPEWQRQGKKIGDHIVFYSTNYNLIEKAISPQLLKSQNAPHDQAWVTQGDVLGKSFDIAIKPLRDYAGQTIGHLVVLKDRTNLISRIRLVLFLNIVIYIIVLSSIAWAVSKGLSKTVIDPIIQLTEAADNVSMGKLEEKIEIKSGDEIQSLAKALDRMRVSMKKMLEE
jgi:methyl-accepting chemotaxis protein